MWAVAAASDLLGAHEQEAGGAGELTFLLLGEVSFLGHRGGDLFLLLVFPVLLVGLEAVLEDGVEVGLDVVGVELLLLFLLLVVRAAPGRAGLGLGRLGLGRLLVDEGFLGVVGEVVVGVDELVGVDVAREVVIVVAELVLVDVVAEVGFRELVLDLVVGAGVVVCRLDQSWQSPAPRWAFVRGAS